MVTDIDSISISDWRKIYGEELYDHRFDGEENINLADRYGFEEIKKRLLGRLMDQFPRQIIRSDQIHRLNINFRQ